MNFYYDIKFNVLGTIYATLGVVVTSFYQVVSIILYYKDGYFIDIPILLKESQKDKPVLVLN